MLKSIATNVSTRAMQLTGENFANIVLPLMAEIRKVSNNLLKYFFYATVNKAFFFLQISLLLKF